MDIRVFQSLINEPEVGSLELFLNKQLGKCIQTRVFKTLRLQPLCPILNKQIGVKKNNYGDSHVKVINVSP